MSFRIGASLLTRFFVQKRLLYSRTMSSKPVPLTLIAKPVRLRVLEHLDRSGPAVLGELARAAGVHANTARGHVAALEDAGVLVRDHVATGARGRPAVRYRLAEGWRLPSTDFKGVAEMLAASIASLDPRPKQLQTLGEEWGRWLAGRPGTGDVRELVPAAMATLGFDARLDDDTAHLAGCPCRLVLPDRPELVCRLAAAVVDGLAAVSRERLQVQSSVYDPVARKCELRLGPRRAPRHRLLPLRLRHR
jgi:predicted ArsR family transcriptional regulator